MNSITNRRTGKLRFVLFLLMALLILRLTYLQVFQGKALADKAEAVWQEIETIPAVRGTIYDRNGNKLAYTTVAYTVSADLNQMREAHKKDPSKGNPEDYARQLAPLLDMPESQIYKILTSTDGVGFDLKQQVDEATKEKIENLKLPGIFFTRTSKRVYPNNELAAHVLGYVFDDGKQGAGIEGEYNKYLRGTDGKTTYLKDSKGNPLPYDHRQTIPAKNGNDVYLTIDETLQYFAESALDHMYQKYHPKTASIVVADPNTGEILALANRPTYNPNKFNEYPQEVLDNNWAVNASFEPGSTFKIVTLTAALTEKKARLDETFPSGSITVMNKQIHDWNYEGWGTITFREGVVHSSNVGFVILGQRLGKKLLYDYIYKFGFDTKTGIDLPGEGDSLLFNVDKMTDLDLAVTSFGQGVSVTPMQQVSAVTAVANGGKVMRPYLLKEVREPNGGPTVFENKPLVRSEVSNPDVMAQVRSAMEDVVKDDESKAAYVPGYHIAGKTGTAQIPKPGGGYYPDRYITSFIGFAPADKPKLLVYVTADYPRDAVQFGNVVASPVAKEFFQNALPYLGIAPDSDGKKQEKNKDDQAVSYVEVPDFTNLTKEQAEDLAKKTKLNLQVLGNDAKVTNQWPAPGSKVVSGSSEMVLLGRATGKDGTVPVPDLSGKSVRDVAEILTFLGLSFEPSGSGYAVSQDKPPGTGVPPGTKIKVTFAPQSQ
jgi:stage V sporulation protein D (sporulation-specific penicillin-binding protein)